MGRRGLGVGREGEGRRGKRKEKEEEEEEEEEEVEEAGGRNTEHGNGNNIVCESGETMVRLSLINFCLRERIEERRVALRDQ